MMRRWPARWMLTVLLSLCALTGCGGSASPLYEFDFKDKTGTKERQIGDLQVKWAEWDIDQSSVPSHANSLPGPVPANADVKWTDLKTGERYHVIVDIPESDRRMMQQRQVKEPSDVFYVVFLPNQEVVIKGFLDEDTTGRPKEMDEILQFLAHDQPAYSVGVQNHTPGKLKDVSVRFGDFYLNGVTKLMKVPEPVSKYGWGNGWDVHWGLPFPVTDTAVINWTTPDGVQHESAVEIKPHLPADLNGQTLCFLICSDNTVAFRVRPFKERRTWVGEDLLEQEVSID